MSGMSKKHFIAVAKAFKHRVDYQRSVSNVSPQIVSSALRELEILALGMCDVFKQLNPEFRKETFMSACGFDS